MLRFPSGRILSRASRLFAIALMTLGAFSSDIGRASAADEPVYPTFGSIERLDPDLDRLIPPNAVLEKLAEGYDWSEGPAWDKKNGYLLFSDVPMNTVFKFKPGSTVSVFLKPSGYTGTTPRNGEPGSNGLVFDPQGRLVLCQHGDRRVARLEADGTFKTLADRFEGKRFNSPNDAAYKSNGDLYFTDPPYGLLGDQHEIGKELDFNGVYRLSKDGKLSLLTKEMTFPNGIAFSPDEKTLYVANSDPKLAIWKAFPVREDGSLGPGRVFKDVTELGKKRKGLPDGMKVDSQGNLFASGPGGILVIDSEGNHLGTILTGEATANCGWGGDGSTLYITADMYLARIKLKTKGDDF